MQHFIFEQFLFYSSIIFLLFLPGYFLLLAIWNKNNSFNSLEKIIISLGSSVAIINFLALALDKLNIPLNKFSLIISVLFFIFLTLAWHFFKKRTGKDNAEKQENSFSFSRIQTFSIILILFLTVFIKSIYLTNTIFPTSTDLGHHMYWSKEIATSGKIPVYQKSDIIKVDSEYAISQPQKIADFIVGEHIIFAAISILSGASFISAFPSLILFLINIATVIALFILSLEIFKNFSQRKNIALMVLFLAGPIFALSSPQTKFVSGGVIGNTLGNFFIPLILFFLIKAFRERKPQFLSFALFLGLGLAYIHHLSAFVFIFLLIFSFIFFIILNFQKLLTHFKEWLRIIFSLPVLGMMLFAIVMIFIVYTPTYLNFSAIDTAIGTPLKTTRTGLTFTQLSSSSGEARIIFGILGLIILLLNKKFNKEYGSVFILGWAISLFAMSLAPKILFVDIPSDRIANYIIFPLIILSGFSFMHIFEWIKSSADTKNSALLTKNSFALFVFFFFVTLISTNGFSDNSSSLSAGGNTEEAVQTFHASQYLSETIGENDILLKDHNYVTADSWIKLFFMNDYNYPFSRGYFKRYEDAFKQREQCTLLMISSPNSTEAKKCFAGTKTDFIMVNPQYDNVQFKKTKDFWQIYSSDKITIFHRP
ncbi:MAG: hypothetical protein ACD_11C00020G0006 [uncultured bacterium]|nr:MAG: hypothetical protein ACD_11C00020G0006 [uncultured bacterium]HBR71291.1 hypothetical protein [Candidatus Moranbacteria bacterium]